MDGAITLIWCLIGIFGLLMLYKLGMGLRHLLLVYFGVATTAVVIHSQRCDEDGEAYLQGHYVYEDSRGHEHSFGFRICSYWPVDEQWRRVMQLYTQGAQNRVRYVRWLPTLHEIQSPLQSAYPVPMAKGSEERKLSVTS